jgi:Flp pilus assembly protein protease CpaA
MDHLTKTHNLVRSKHTKNSLSQYKSRSTMMNKILILLFALAILIRTIEGGPLSYAICQTGCNAVAVACYAGAGFTFGTVTAGAGAPAAIVACNTALGYCMAQCVVAGLIPTP